MGILFDLMGNKITNIDSKELAEQIWSGLFQILINLLLFTYCY